MLSTRFLKNPSNKNIIHFLEFPKKGEVRDED